MCHLSTSCSPIVGGLQTHIQQVGNVTHIIVADGSIGSMEAQQVVIPGLGTFQLALHKLGLPLQGVKESLRSIRLGGWVIAAIPRMV